MNTNHSKNRIENKESASGSIPREAPESFKRLGIIEPVLRVIAEEGFEEPSEIQEKSIPYVVQGKDVIAQSATGSGKTLAFGAGIIQTCNGGSGIQALVLTPTRELAEQVGVAIRKFSKHKKLRVTLVYGGVSINPQIDDLRKADVVVGTPGRILDHINRNTINLSRVKIFVLDEADRMFDMGFIDDVKDIVSLCPTERQTLLFSATITPEVARLAQKYMKNPVEVSAESYVDPSKLRQVYYDVQDKLKFSVLVHLMRNEKTGLVMVFCNSRNTTDFVVNNLKSNGIEAMALHGGFSQDKRSKALRQFHSQNVYVLVCTDVAARGLDIPGVSHVYNYDIPKDSKQYVHRIGRTARAGAEGIAVNLLSERDHENFTRVLRDNSVRVEKMETPYVERVKIGWTPDSRRRGSEFGRFDRGRERRPDDRRGGEGRGRSSRDGNRGERRPEDRREQRHDGSAGQRHPERREGSPGRSERHDNSNSRSSDRGRFGSSRDRFSHGRR